MVYKCIKCQKEFDCRSKLLRHENNKNPCIKEKNKHNCNICNTNFRWKSEYLKHKKTKKHIININNNININNSIDNSIENNINNIFNIQFPLYTFKNSNLDLINENSIYNMLHDYIIGTNCTIKQLQNGETKTIIEKINRHYNIESIMKNANLNKEKHINIIAFIECLILIIKELNFNVKDIEKFQNNNIKILLFLNKYTRNTNIFQYLIFDVNENNQLYWKEITYCQFIDELLNLSELLNNKFKLERLNVIIIYLNKYFRYDKELIEDYKESIESLLSHIYNIIEVTPNKDITKNIVKKEIKPYNNIDYEIKYLD